MPLHISSYTFGSTLLLSAALFLVGCGKEESRYIEVEEAPPSIQSEPSAGSGTTPISTQAGSSDVGFQYAVPQGWTEVAPSSMKLISILCGSGPEQQAECSVSAFPGDVGGQLANINRWRRQVGLGPLAMDAMDGFVENVSVSGMEGWQVDFTGPGGNTRVIVAVVFQAGKSWFFKLMGPAAAVEEEKAAFATFLESVQF